MSYPFDPNRLEATVIDLLALNRYTHADWLIQPESVEGFADRLRRRAAPEHCRCARRHDADPQCHAAGAKPRRRARTLRVKGAVCMGQ
jgi:hypothetical protein